MNKHLIWAGALVLIFGMVCGTLIYLNENPYIIEIGNNTLDGIKSINYTEIQKINSNCYSERCLWDIENNRIVDCSMYMVDCRNFEEKYGGNLG